MTGFFAFCGLLLAGLLVEHGLSKIADAILKHASVMQGRK